MKYVSYLPLLLCICSLLCCEDSQVTKPKQADPINNDTAEEPTTVPLFWEEVCGDDRFRNLFDCSNSLECYQVELVNDPFKDLVVLSIDINDPSRDIIYYNRFSFSLGRSGRYEKNKLYSKVFIVNPITKDTIFASYNCETKKRRRTLRYLFGAKP
jgi:hypothetical protein